MQHFVELIDVLDQSSHTTEQVAALVRNFKLANPQDATWALSLLLGQRLSRAVKLSSLRTWLGQVVSLPEWLIEESIHAVGDLPETIALLLPPPTAISQLTLTELIEQRVLPLRGMQTDEQQQLVQLTWSQLTTRQICLYHQLLLGSFRVRVPRPVLAQALAQLAGCPTAVMSHRLLAIKQVTTATLDQLLRTVQAHEPGEPYPFYLANPCLSNGMDLGPLNDWQLEWHWDGIRAQLIRRAGQTMLWTRGEELVTDRYPEIFAAAQHLPDGVVLDGQIIAWHVEQPLPYQLLQQRVSQKQPNQQVVESSPVVFMAFDLLEQAGIDIRNAPLIARREKLTQLFKELAASTNAGLRLSPLLTATNWDEVDQLRQTARQQHCQGLLLKQRSSSYGEGRELAQWWKWNCEPLSIKAVLIAAQAGSSGRSKHFTDYTFAVWHAGELLPIAKTNVGLSDSDKLAIDAFVRAHLTGRFGPVRGVSPELVFELHFIGVLHSTRHKSGLTIRSPRIAQRLTDHTAAQADSLADLQQLVPQVHKASPRKKTLTKRNTDPRQQQLFDDQTD